MYVRFTAMDLIGTGVEDHPRLEYIELLALDLHLRSPHVTATGVTTRRPVVIVHLGTDHADGWGECAALPAPDYSEEHARGAWLVLADYLVPLVIETTSKLGGHLPELEELRRVFSRIERNSMAKAALEMAVLDSWLRSSSTSLCRYLGVGRTHVDAGSVIGIVRDPSAAVERALHLHSRGYKRVKVKISPEADLAALRAIATELPDLDIHADANGTYRPEDAEHRKRLKALDEIGLMCLEQPFPADELLAHARLAEEIETPVCLDESLSSMGVLRDAIRLGACEIACIKPSRLGGLLAGVRAIELCEKAGVPAWIGGMLETSLARSANAALAGLEGIVLPGDIEGGERFEEADPFGSGMAGPSATVEIFAGAGVGPEPDRDLLDAVTSERLLFAV